VEENNRIIQALGAPAVDAGQVRDDYVAAAAYLAPFTADTVALLNHAVQRGESVLFEGAQGTLLDIDYGTYPYVTSSNATAGGACTGSGIAPHRIDNVVGVVKAYSTRVGEGPFPTELHDATGAKLRETGHEFGATTGRPRRCGWFDVVVARYSAMINGIDTWAITKLDVLDDIDPIRICVAYECDGKVYDTVPANIRVLEGCRPVYEDFPGWTCSTKEATRFSELPRGAQGYVRRLCALTGVPAGILSVGPRRSSTMRVSAGELAG
jgi:adenylosuccinate synthase